MGQIEIRPVTTADRDWVIEILNRFWGSSIVVSRGKGYHADQLPGFVALHRGEAVGLLTYALTGPDCEIVTLNSLWEDQGVGSGLVRFVEDVARLAECSRLFLMTTNSNLRALRFYRRRGFSVVSIHKAAIHRSRANKSELPLIGYDNNPIDDEIEMEKVL
jgi:N-acetylglutamate synthase-like GNAT family acetyltransferase